MDGSLNVAIMTAFMEQGGTYYRLYTGGPEID